MSDHNGFDLEDAQKRLFGGMEHDNVSAATHGTRRVFRVVVGVALVCFLLSGLVSCIANGGETLPGGIAPVFAIGVILMVVALVLSYFKGD